MDVTAIRAQLEATLGEFRARHKVLDDHLHNRDREVPADSKEQATFAENDEVLEALDEATLERITALLNALRRMDQGIWSTCVSCGDEIDPRRLQALPTAAQCVDCAGKAG